MKKVVRALTTDLDIPPSEGSETLITWQLIRVCPHGRTEVGGRYTVHVCAYCSPSGLKVGVHTVLHGIRSHWLLLSCMSMVWYGTIQSCRSLQLGSALSEIGKSSKNLLFLTMDMSRSRTPFETRVARGRTDLAALLQNVGYGVR